MIKAVENFEYKDPQTIKIGGKEYNVYLAFSDEEKEIGLSLEKSLQENEGMLFIYDKEEDVIFTSKDMSFPIDIIFIDGDQEVISVHTMEAHDPNDPSEEDVLFVLELNANSGVKPGDKLEADFIEPDEEEDYSDKVNTKNLILLNSEGGVQYQIVPGSRIFSRIFTRKLLKLAIKAYRNEEDKDYKKVAKMIFRELLALDNRPAAYVESPD